MPADHLVVPKRLQYAQAPADGGCVVLAAAPVHHAAQLQRLLGPPGLSSVLRPWQALQPHGAGTAAVLLHTMDVMLAAFLLVLCDEARSRPWRPGWTCRSRGADWLWAQVIVLSSSQAGDGTWDVLEEAALTAQPAAAALKVGPPAAQALQACSGGPPPDRALQQTRLAHAWCCSLHWSLSGAAGHAAAGWEEQTRARWQRSCTPGEPPSRAGWRAWRSASHTPACSCRGGQDIIEQRAELQGTACCSRLRAAAAAAVS